MSPASEPLYALRLIIVEAADSVASVFKVNDGFMLRDISEWAQSGLQPSADHTVDCVSTLLSDETLMMSMNALIDFH